tara:strand:+ start:409 stop:546 length:138 start_codon:yes stop_codon:yes gene_type:complete
MLPQEITEAGKPLTPRKLRDASIRTALPIKEVDTTIRDAKVLGRT